MTSDRLQSRKKRLPLPEWKPEQIRLLRQRIGHTQAQFGERLAVRQATVSVWENGKQRPMRRMRRLLTEIAQYVHFPMKQEEPHE